jgi:hypothetical protein
MRGDEPTPSEGVGRGREDSRPGRDEDRARKKAE